MVMDAKVTVISAPLVKPYVAPVYDAKGNKRGERLTLPLPVDTRTVAHYTSKGFRVATEEDIKRLEQPTPDIPSTVDPKAGMEREVALLAQLRREQNAPVARQEAAPKPSSHDSTARRRSK